MREIMINILKVMGVCLLFILASCQPPPEAEKPKGVLRIATAPTDMPIIIDGQPKGNSPPGEGQYFTISLDEGEHLIEILKPTNNEKEQYAKKTVFLAADTIAIAELEAKERLTPFGEQEKARRDSEEAEKKRQAELDDIRKQKEEKDKIAKVKKLQAERHIKMVKLNKEHASYINEQVINIGDKNVSTQRFSISGCNINFESQLRENVQSKHIDAQNLRPLKTENFEKSSEWMYNSRNSSYKAGIYQIEVECKENRKCIKRSLGDNGHEWRSRTQLMKGVLVKEKRLRDVFNKLDKIINNCQ